MMMLEREMVNVVAASLRNFFITFVVALALFVGLAWHYYGDLVALLPQSGMEESEVSGDTVSGETSQGAIYLPDVDSDNLGILHGLVVRKNVEDEVVEATFLRLNSDRKAVLSCELPLTMTLYNDVGSLVPLRDFFRIYDMETCSMAVASLTGYHADFYLEYSPASLDAMVQNMVDPHFYIDQEIKYVNPVYADQVFAPGTAYPSDYWKRVVAGENTLDGDKLAILREHYALCDGSDGHGTYDALAESMLSALFLQLRTEQKTVMLSDAARFADVLSGMETNMDKAFLEAWGTLLMKYSQYQAVPIEYTTRDATLKAFKEADQ